MKPGYLADILEPGEKPVIMTHLHWVYLLTGLTWFLGFFAIGAAIYAAVDYYVGPTVGAQIIQGFGLRLNIGEPSLWLLGFCVAAGLMIFLLDYIKYMVTKIILTNRQIVYKTGLINIKIDETDLDVIQAVHVNQGILGHILGYGRLHLDCRFVDDVYLPYIRKPYIFVKAINAARAKLAHGVTFNNPMPPAPGQGQGVHAGEGMK